MNEQEILKADLSKAEKCRKLFDLGKTQKEVANLVLGGNTGWAYNIQKAYNEKKLKEKEQRGEATGKEKAQASTTVNKQTKGEPAAKLSIQTAAVKKGPQAKVAASTQKPAPAKKAAAVKPTAKTTARPATGNTSKTGQKAKSKQKGRRL